MFSIIKLHIIYLCNRINLIVISLVTIFISVILLINAGVLDTQINRWFFQNQFFNNYFSNFINISKIIYILLNCYLYSSSFLKHNDNYHYLIPFFHQSREKYYFTKIIAIYIINLIIAILLYSNYYLIGYTVIENFIFIKKHFILLIELQLIGCIYGLIAMMIVFLIPSMLSCFLSYVIFILSELILTNELNIINKFTIIFLPNINFDNLNINSNLGFVALIGLIVFYLFVGMILYQNKELY